VKIVGKLLMRMIETVTPVDFSIQKIDMRI